MCDEEMSGGNSREAVSRALNSSSSKPTANLTASEALAFSTTLRFLTLGYMDGFAEALISSTTLRFSALRRTGGFANNEGFSLFL